MKPRFFDGNNWTEFENELEHNAFISSNSPTDPILIAKILKIEKAEWLGKFLVRELNDDMDAMNLTEAQELDLSNRVHLVLTYLSIGMPGRARKTLNAMTVAGQLTLARKNFILNKIDALITQLG